MRLSIRQTDPGYSPKAFSAKVFLDGEELSKCFTADEELGEAHCYVLEEDTEELKEVILRGDVVIAQ